MAVELMISLPEQFSCHERSREAGQPTGRRAGEYCRRCLSAPSDRARGTAGTNTSRRPEPIPGAVRCSAPGMVKEPNSVPHGLDPAFLQDPAAFQLTLGSTLRGQVELHFLDLAREGERRLVLVRRRDH